MSSRRRNLECASSIHDEENEMPIHPDVDGVDVDAVAPIIIGPGCTRRDLPAPAGLRIWVVDIAAGAQWPRVDRHGAGGEFVYVVSGELIDGGQRYGAGTHLAYAPHSEHQPHSERGVRLYGINPLAKAGDDGRA
jgi:hypothetical protein